jgi:predicted membrane-bound dolichyl-phosphate-mannose-protein mannosyltransferase
MKGSQSLTGLLTMKRYAMVFLASLAILAAGVAAKQQFMSDEVFYVGAARGFIAGTASVNPEHPPLAKYLIALSIKTLAMSHSRGGSPPQSPGRWRHSRRSG